MHLLQSAILDERGMYLTLQCCFALYTGDITKGKETFNLSCFHCSRSCKILWTYLQLIKNVIVHLLPKKKKNCSLYHLRIWSVLYFLSVFSYLNFMLASMQRLKLYWYQYHCILWGEEHAQWDFCLVLLMFAYWTVQIILHGSTNSPCLHL